MKDYLVIVTKDNTVWLNFDKPVGSILLKKIHEIMEIIRKDEISRDHD